MAPNRLPTRPKERHPRYQLAISFPQGFPQVWFHGEDEGDLAAVAVGDEVVDPVHRELQGFVFPFEFDFSLSHDAVDEAAVSGGDFFLLGEGLEPVAEGLLDVLFELDWRRAITRLYL